MFYELTNVGKFGVLNITFIKHRFLKAYRPREFFQHLYVYYCHGNLRGLPQCHVYPKKEGPDKALILIKGNQWLIVPDHKGHGLCLGG